MRPIMLMDLVDRPQWVGWRAEARNGKKTKIPYFAPDRCAEADNPATWRTRAEAANVGRQIINGEGGGVGLMLGPCGDASLAGVDLDSCRDPTAGEIAPWAAEVLRRLDTYSEISPSRGA